MSVPLWSVLPTKQFAILGEGVVKNRRWGIYVFKNDRRGASRRPCIENVTLRYEHHSISPAHGEPSCGVLAPPSEVPVTTEYVFSNVGGIVVGMTLGLAVAHVSMQLSMGPALERFDQVDQLKTGKKGQGRRFRYIAVGIGRKACLEASEGMARNGDTLFQAPPQECVLSSFEVQALRLRNVIEWLPPSNAGLNRTRLRAELSGRRASVPAAIRTRGATMFDKGAIPRRFRW